MVAVLDNGRKDFYVGIYPPTGDYELLDNQPAIGGVVLTKNTTKADLDLDKVFQYRGQVASYNKLPTKNRVIGDTYNVQDTGENYAWNGSSWDLLTGTEAVYWRNGALESQGSTLTIDSDKNPISNLVLEDITDITATAAEVNVLDGITASTAELNIMDGVTASTAELNILDGVTADANELNILDGATLTTTELNYVDGVTSSIQTQLNEKQPNITGAATTITSSNLTTNRAVISNNSGKVAVSDTTSTELGYVHGVTSAIQTQLNNKISVNGGNITDSNWDNADYHSIDSNIVSENVNFAESTIGWKASPVDNEDLAVNLIKYNLADELGGSKYVFYDFLGNLNFVDKNDHSTRYCVDKIVHTTVYNNTAFRVNYALPSKNMDSTLAVTSDIPTTASQIGAVAANADITAGTGTKITYDSKGLVTGSASLSANDIPDISGTYQTVISDLETIRTGAGKGATSVQPSSNNDAPTTSTVGTLCQLYVDTATQTGYMCVGIDDTDPENIVYTWKQITI